MRLGTAESLHTATRCLLHRCCDRAQLCQRTFRQCIHHTAALQVLPVGLLLCVHLVVMRKSVVGLTESDGSDLMGALCLAGFGSQERVFFDWI